jgi:hypothetical protein
MRIRENMSPPITEFDPTQFNLAVRFDQGYRFLDKCGEAVIRLENTLDPGWIPGELKPTGGSLRNYTLGLGTTFDTNSLSVIQTEYLSFENFLDQSCKIFQTIRGTFDIKRIITPVLRVITQVGFPEVEDAERFLLDLHLCVPDRELVRQLGGTESALNFTVCTNVTENWDNVPIDTRGRVDVRVVRQERQPMFDERIMLRLPLVSSRYHETIAAHRKLRRQHPRIVDVALQVDCERSFESEFNSATFDLSRFLRSSYDWAAKMATFFRNRMKKQCSTK